MNYQYIRIAGQLRRAILGGRLPAGLPPERALAEKFGVARPTLRQALKVLENENLIQRRQGRGTSLNPLPSRRIPLMIDYTGSMRRYAANLRRTVLFSKWIKAGAELAAALRLQSGDPVLSAERVDFLKGAPVAYDRAYIAAPFGRRLTARDLARVDFVETWERRSNFKVTVCRQFIDALRAEKDVVRYLKMESGWPVLKSTEIYYAARNRPAGLFESFYNPGVIRIASVFQWPQARTTGMPSRP